MQHKPTRIPKYGDKGEDIRRLQVAVNDRDRAPNIIADGEYGPTTEKAALETALVLGVSHKTLAKGLTRGAQAIIRAPKRRTPVQLARARALKKERAKAAANKPLRLRAFDEAVKFLNAGVREVGGNNLGAQVVAIIRGNGGVPGESWCGDFVAVCYMKAGYTKVARWWASTISLLAYLAKTTGPLRGMIVVYDFGSGGAKHTGLFDEWEIPGKTFWAIEGNTGPAGSSDASDHAGGVDGVHRKLRNIDLVAGFRHVNA